MQSLRNKSNITFNILVRQCKNLLILKDFYKKEHYKQNLIKALTHKSYFRKLLVMPTTMSISSVLLCINASYRKPYIIYINPGTYVSETIIVPEYVWIFGSNTTIKNFSKNDGGHCWFFNGKLHCNDGPAINIKIQNIRHHEWYQYGKRHRDFSNGKFGPAVFAFRENESKIEKLFEQWWENDIMSTAVSYNRDNIPFIKPTI